MRDLITVAAGPAVLVGRGLAPIAGIDSAYIFGSWAARDAGEPGRAPRDIDVLIVAADRVDAGALGQACAAASNILGREVNPITITMDAWNDPDSAFVTAVRARPMTPVDISDGQPLLPGSKAPDGPDEDLDDWAAQLLEP